MHLKCVGAHCPTPKESEWKQREYKLDGIEFGLSFRENGLCSESPRFQFHCISNFALDIDSIGNNQTLNGGAKWIYLNHWIIPNMMRCARATCAMNFASGE